MDNRPIGVFDSGLGGLTVVKEIKKILPNEKIIYFGDTARVPYGAKSRKTVTSFSKSNIEFLLKHNVKLVVVACNTASSLSLAKLRRSFKVPIVGVIRPGVKKALDVSKKNKIGVIGTRATISSGAYERLIKNGRPRAEVVSKACPLFVPLVEEGWLDNGITAKIVDEYLAEFKSKRIEALILGCTHYPLLKGAICRYMGEGVELVDSAEETAKTVKAVLSEKKIFSNRKSKVASRYFVTDEPSAFKAVGERFLGSRIESIRRVKV